MNAIIVFCKNYNLAKVKTRISQDISDSFAKNFYVHCIIDINITLKKIPIPNFIFWYPVPIKKSWNNFSQEGKNLGEKMYNAFKKIFNLGFQEVVIIGSDIPQISEKIIFDAFNFLKNYDYVLGPCYDGGYYLIGTKRNNLDLEIFKNIKWSSDKVLMQTIEKLDKKGYSHYFLKKLYDIDTLSELKIFYNSYKKSSLNTIKFLKQNYENFCNNSCL